MSSKREQTAKRPKYIFVQVERPKEKRSKYVFVLANDIEVPRATLAVKSEVPHAA